MRKKIWIIFIVFCSMFTMGCPALLVGAGASAGAGVFSYMNGELKRTYPANYEDMLKASIDSLKDLKIKIEAQKQTKENVTTIKSMRSDGTPITIKILPVSLKLTKVSVRSGRMGLWEKKTSKLIHVTIANKVFQ